MRHLLCFGVLLRAGIERPLPLYSARVPFRLLHGSHPMLQSRRGFTLIELLVVVVVIGILSTIAIPKYAATKGKASFAGMKSDLRNMTVAQESFFYDHSRYSPSLDSIEFLGSPGDTLVIHEATGTGWSATSSNPLSYPHFCAMFFGTAAPVPPATEAGVVTCQ
jgi:prepilin-type N-terminal cleavage/methylation domain-containing protein